MTPDVDGLLRTSFLTLVGEVAPALGGYLAGSAGAIGALLFMAAAEYERGADIRVAENAEMRALLAEGASLVAYADLAGRLLRLDDLRHAPGLDRQRHQRPHLCVTQMRRCPRINVSNALPDKQAAASAGKKHIRQRPENKGRPSAEKTCSVQSWGGTCV